MDNKEERDCFNLVYSKTKMPKNKAQLINLLYNFWAIGKADKTREIRQKLESIIN